MSCSNAETDAPLSMLYHGVAKTANVSKDVWIIS
jgi:hypothetical protein